MEKPNTELEAMLADFSRRYEGDPAKSAQLRAAVTASDQTVTAFNQAAAAQRIRSFGVDARSGANSVGHLDQATGSVDLPQSAFGAEGSAPSKDLVADCRVQSMIASFAVARTQDKAGNWHTASPRMIENLQGAINESPFLADEIKRASTAADGTGRTRFALERFELLPANSNQGGAYASATRTMLLPSDAFDPPGQGKYKPVATTFVLAHEIQHAFNRQYALQAKIDFDESVKRMSRTKDPIHDYTPILEKYIGQVRNDESLGQIAGWNAVRSRLEASGVKPTLTNMGNADDRMRDFVPFRERLSDPAVMRSGYELRSDLTMDPTPENIEAAGKHYFDRPTRDHIPPGNTERVLGINHDYVSNYPNHYGKQAIEDILAAEERAPLVNGSKPEVRIDMDRLGLYEDVLEKQGLDLTRSHDRFPYFDSSPAHPGVQHFDHTIDGRNAHRAVGTAPEVSLSPTAPERRTDPLIAHVRGILPHDASDDRVAQIALAAKQGGIEAGKIRTVDVIDQTMVLTGTTPGTRASIDLTLPPPPAEESQQQLGALADQQVQAQQAQLNQQQISPSMSMSQ